MHLRKNKIDNTGMADDKYDIHGIFLKGNDMTGAKLVKEPSEFSAEELKRQLEIHGQKKSGKKHELVEIIKGLLKLNVKIDPKVDGGHWHNVKISVNKQNNDSTNFLIPQVGWTMFPSQDIPVNFNYGHVYHYIIESVNNVFLLNSGTFIYLFIYLPIYLKLTMIKKILYTKIQIKQPGAN